MYSKVYKILLLFFILVSLFNGASAQQVGNDYSYQPTCQNHTKSQLAWTLENTWLSTDKTGDWRTDTWFYHLKAYQPVHVIKIDGEYYLVCFQFDERWTPIYGWARKQTVLLNKDVR